MIARNPIDLATDEVVFAYALQEGCAVVKDSDFTEMAQLRRVSPKVVWLGHGNHSTGEIETAIRTHPYATFALFGNVPAEDLEGSLGDGIAATLRAHAPSGAQWIRALPC